MKTAFLMITAFVLLAVNTFAQSEVVTCQNRKYPLIGKQTLETVSQTGTDYMYYGYNKDTIVITITTYNNEKVLRSVNVQKMALSDFAYSSYTDSQGNLHEKKGTYNISWASDSSYCIVNLNIGTGAKLAMKISDSGCLYTTRPMFSKEKNVYVRFRDAALAEAFLAEFKAKTKKFEKK